MPDYSDVYLFIAGLLISPDGNYLNICDSKGSLALYDSSQSYGLIRLLPNALARLQDVSFNSIVIDDKGRRLACIGPSEFVINVFDARSLDEVSFNIIIIIITIIIIVYYKTTICINYTLQPMILSFIYL